MLDANATVPCASAMVLALVKSEPDHIMLSWTPALTLRFDHGMLRTTARGSPCSSLA